MLASSFMDPVLGVDVHFEMVPTPAPVPTPIPNPFTGVVFDPVGLAVGLVLGAAVSAVLGAPMQGPVMYWTAFPATNTGTEAKHVPGHIIIPPGTAWAPFPKTPKPVIHPGETPEPALPVKPEDDAVVIFGSKTVTVMGSNAVRLGDMALSCSEPVRLPSSVVLAVPKGAPILIGGPPSLDILAAIMASLRTRFISDSLHAAVSRLKPSRFRNFLHRAVCFVTGHPVDVATGKVLTEAVDAELPGVLPLKIERVYSSAFSSRATMLGHGWSSSLDQAVWRERGRVVLRAEDGREIEFDTFGLPRHRIEPGQRMYNAVERLTLHCDTDDRWRVVDHEGVTRHFTPVPGGRSGVAAIAKITARAGAEITFLYDEHGRLQWVRDAVGRTMGFRHDRQGRMTELHLPRVSGEGFYCHRRYEYDLAGDLVAVHDSLGQAWRYQYMGHLLTVETDRNGQSFYFAYDGMGEDAWCTRTWGDGGVYDHVLTYDKHQRVTYVVDSLGNGKQYHMNPIGQVVKIVDALGGETTFAYDPETFRRTEMVEPGGGKTAFEYDARGNQIAITGPDGTGVRYEYDERAVGPITATDQAGHAWQWTYDGRGRVTSCRLPTGHGTTYAYGEVLPTEATLPDGARVRFEHDAHGNLSAMTDAAGGILRRKYDAHGRTIETTLPTGAKERYRFDTEGRLRGVDNQFGNVRRYHYDPEGNLVRVEEAGRTTEFEYGPCYRPQRRTVGGIATTYRYDTELRLIEVQNAAGERHIMQRDELGRVVIETAFDGRRSTFEYDADSKLTKMERGSGRTTQLQYDAAGRLAEVSHSDGTGERFEYRADGQLIAATNEHAQVELDRDPMGRVIAERTTLADGRATTVGSTRRGDGQRVRVELAGDGLNLAQLIERDAVGYVSGVAVPDRNWHVAFSRDAMGVELTRTFSSGANGSWQRDPLGRPQRRVVSGTELSHEREFEWASEMRLAQITDSATGKTELVYDNQGRLVQAKGGDGIASTRTLDVVANPFERTDGTDRRYDTGGRIAQSSDHSFEYDDDAMLAARVGRDGARRSFAWSDGGNLTEIELEDGRRVQYTYDALGRRLQRSVHDDGEVVDERQWVWDGNVPIAERDRVGAPVHWLFEPGGFVPLARLDDTGALSAFVDPSGAPTEWVDDGGRLVARVRTDLSGRQRILEGHDIAPPWGYPGQYHDADSGLVYNRFRYLDPQLGSYIQPDPLGLYGGLHPRAYVPDPLFGADPLGLAYRTWQIHSPGYPDVVQKGLHFYAPGGIELAVRPDHQGGITFTNAIPNEAGDSRLPGAIKAATDRFENNATFRGDILQKAREGVPALIQHAKDQSADSLRQLANGRSREMRDIARNVERKEGGGGCP